jgi:hypothetical protein
MPSFSPAIARLASWGCLLLVGGFFAIVFWGMLTRRIRLNGLLDGDQTDGATLTTSFSPGRAQLLLVTLASALYFLVQVIRNPSAFPSVPPPLLLVFGASNAAYLGGKAYSLLYRSGPNNLRRRKE